MQKKNAFGKAAIWTDKRTMQFDQFPVPVAKNGGLVLKVDAAAVCGTDGHLFPQKPPYPCILGHEVTGTIVDMSDGTNASMNVYGGPLKVGDRVALYPWVTCGKCPECVKYGSGICTVCNNSFVYGVPYENLGLEGSKGIDSAVKNDPHFMGGFAEYLYVFPETYLWKLPEDMPSEVAVLLDPMAVAMRAIEIAQVCPGVVEEAFNTNSTVAIIGMGPVGILAAILCRLMGVEKIIAIGARQSRLDVVKELADVDEIIDIRKVKPEDRITKVKELTDGMGADVVLQCANTPNAFVEGLEMLRRMGTLIEVGNMVNTGSTIELDPAKHICGKHARVIGMSANSPGAFDKAFHILKRHKKIDFTKIYSHIGSLQDVGDIINKIADDDYIKGLIRF